MGEKKTKLMIYSTQLKLKLKLELSLAKIWHERQHCSSGNDVFKHNETSTVG